MLLRATAAATLAALAPLAPFAMLAACSTVPEATQPPFADHHVAADFVVPDNGRLVLPSSSDALLVRELVLEPPPIAEQFHGDRRWFAYSPGTHVLVRARFRTWAHDGAQPASATQVFAGAERVRDLALP